MVECPACRGSYVTNTIFCPECGLYLLKGEVAATDPLVTDTPGSTALAAVGQPALTASPACPDGQPSLPGRPVQGGDVAASSGTGLLTVCLRIRTPKSPTAPLASHSPFRISHARVMREARSELCHKPGFGAARERVLEVPMTKPIRLGRVDPKKGIYPDVDLTEDLALEYGVSREHACIFRRSDSVEVEDLASTNGTTLNGRRLAPYAPVALQDGDQLQLGRLLIEVSFGASQARRRTTPLGGFASTAETRRAATH